ncbi:MAG: biotin/lipoate A/B protein ligase family protein [Candidatus Methylacidiphilales bacterium]|nr:biotin/lipoate A/B protein ligase family protein [Candidatus Methylacidiphilales bacterium]
MFSVRLIIDPSSDKAWNMAVDEALLRLVCVPVLRIYRWTEPAVSIGYFEKASDVPAGRPFVRRYTGGGLVDHAEDFTYTLVLPKDHPLTLAGTGPSYEAIHAGINTALQREGIDARLTPVNDAVDHHACFQKAVRFDIVDAKGRKLAGAAQRRTREGCLHQGSILPGKFDFDSLARNTAQALEPVLEGTLEESSLTRAEIAKAQELEASRYRTREWNESR